MRTLFHDDAGSSIATITNRTGDFVVRAALPEKCGGLALELSGGYLLRVFPTNSREEDWALVTPPGEPHLVVTGGKVERQASVRSPGR